MVWARVSAAGHLLPSLSESNVNNKSHIITAVVDQPGDGVLVAQAGSWAAMRYS